MRLSTPSMNNGRMALSGLKRQKDMSQKLRMYSKSWQAGDTMRVIFPVEQFDGVWEILAGGVWGHKVNDFEGIGLKTALIPSSTDFDENGMPVGVPDITYQFSQIAPVFVKGQRAEDEAQIMRKNFPTEAAKQDALRKIDYKYDVKNNKKAVTAAIGRATLHIFTEVVAIKIQNDQPVLDSAAIYSFPLASQRIDQLYTLLRDPKYAPMEGDKYWEIEWKYPANPDKDQSARASNPNGLTTEYRMCNQFPDAWKPVLEKCSGIAVDGDTIVRRTTRYIDQARIKSALTNYAIMNSQYLESSADEDKEILIKNANVVKELNVIGTLNDVNLIERLKAEFTAIPATTTIPVEVPDMSTPDLGASVPQQAVPDLGAVASPTINPEAPKVVDLMNNQHSGNMQSLLNNPNLSTMSESELDEVNLEMM